MSIALFSRRSFMKTTVAGAAGTLIRPIAVAANSAGVQGGAAPSNASLSRLTLSEASQLVHARKISPVELTRACLGRIEQLNPKLNAFITVTADSALAEARAAEEEIHRGHWKGPLHGIPLALKDLLDTAAVRTTAASGLFKDRVPLEDAEVVRRLKAAGAVLLGKLNLQEFAYGGSSVVSYFGPVRNPWERDYCAGGSSAGSAAAVAAELCFGALGTDTGGSIRQPAGYCGIVGLKPTYGRVSTRGVIPLAWSLDHVGPMARTVKDVTLMLQVIAGYDAGDTNSADLPVPDFVGSIARGTSALRLGIPRAYFYEGLHPEIEAAMGAALSVLKNLTASQHDIALLAANDHPSVMDVYGTVFTAEAYAYHREYISKTPELYQPETLNRIRAGADIGTPSYIQSRRQLAQIRRSVSRVFDTVDLAVTPTAVVPPFTIANLLSDPATLRSKELLMLRNTRPINALGLPAISIPCGFTRAGLPIGMQIIGPSGGEATVLRLAYAYEQATDWHNRHPTVQ
jgi:aspartyl-tRNA(Asn)/glutamyl-tRNA(Gln) amidotransferase subunit A